MLGKYNKNKYTFDKINFKSNHKIILKLTILVKDEKFKV